MSKTRNRVTIEEFIRVAIVEREKFPTPEAASAELGFASVETFMQKVRREQKECPAVWKDVPDYPRKSQGPKRPSQDEILAMLNKMRGEDESKSEDETNESGDAAGE